MKFYTPDGRLEVLKMRFLPKWILRFWPVRLVELDLGSKVVDLTKYKTTPSTNLSN